MQFYESTKSQMVKEANGVLEIIQKGIQKGKQYYPVHKLIIKLHFECFHFFYIIFDM